MKFLRGAWLNLLVAFLCASMSFAAVPTITGFTTQADGNTITASIWNGQIGAIYTYINSYLVATFNLLTTKGDLLAHNGSAIVKLATGGSANNGKALVIDDSATPGIKWASIASTTALTTKGDLVGYDTNLTRIPVGTDGKVLTAKSSEAAGVSWESSSVPTGTIAVWSGSIASIPSGWQLCDGTNGTPNLQGLMVVGAGNASPAASGGMGLLNPGGPSGDVSSGAGVGPEHSHSATGSVTLSTVTNVQSGSGSSVVIAGTTPVSVGTFAATTTPRYYALAFMMKL